MKTWTLGCVGVVSVALLAGCEAGPRSEDIRNGTVAAKDGGRTATKARATPTPPATLVLPQGTGLVVTLESALASNRSQPGDTFLGRLAEPIEHEGRVIVPSESEVRGHVVAAQGSGRVKGVARLALTFDRITIRGESHPIETTQVDLSASKQHRRDAEIIGGGAAAGAVVGAIADGGGGAGKGGLIGGLAGTGAVLLTKGSEIELPAGRQIRVTLKESVKLER